MLSVVFLFCYLSIIKLSVVVLSVLILNVIMLKIIFYFVFHIFLGVKVQPKYGDTTHVSS